ncbi:hypothetical protein [Roseateles sp.]|uniref:hypothetical protein n=1 Tax=Roseateles sp. TaxID=1971397 RepID=UPI003267E0F0
MPPASPAWDIRFTRLAQTLQPRVQACALGLAQRWRALGLGSDMEVRQTPRGLSSFLSVVGERGLICIVDLTLIDGMAVEAGPYAALDVRLLDGCGDVVAPGLADSSIRLDTTAAQALLPDQLDRAATAVYVAALGHFDLLRPAARQR